MQDNLDAIKKNDAVVFAISADSIEDNASLAKKESFKFPLLCDTKLEVTKAYSLLHEKASIDGTDIPRPAVYILDRKGCIKWRKLTDNWRVRVRPETVLKELEKIQ